MSVLTEFEAFAAAHRLHGPPIGGANEPTAEGYRAHARCPCGAEWDRWVPVEEAARELLMTEFPCLPN
jgi:hypothetical protein